MTTDGNMYSDSIYQWNVFKGCHFTCTYCIPSFQRQAKRQKPHYDENGNKTRGCQECYDYTPHFHPERLKTSLPNTTGDQFIWACSSGDITFAKQEWMELILKRIRELPNKTFFMQTKDPNCFIQYSLPDNLIIGITLETNRWYSHGLSKAPPPLFRADIFEKIYHPRKFVTIEPIMEFETSQFLPLIESINPERIYIGFDTKNCGLIEPSIEKTIKFIELLREKGFDVREKYMKGDKK